MSLETCAATCTGSQNSRRPKAPPLGMTCAFTAVCGRPRSAAIACSATMGVCRPAQISQLPGFTSTIAHSTSSGACEAAGNSKSASIAIVPSGAGSSGGSAAYSADLIEASDRPLFGPSPQVMSSARQASQAWPKVSAITATPGGMPTTVPPPGMISTVPSGCLYSKSLPCSTCL